MPDTPRRTSSNVEMPSVFTAADRASGRAQGEYLALSASRLCTLALAAIFGALTAVWDSEILRVAILALFLLAAMSEFALLIRQPERTWYAGRAVAESTKTLAWRYAVGGDPFGHGIKSSVAEDLLRSRIADVLRKGRDRMEIKAGDAIVTPSMRQLRSAAFVERKRTYLNERTGDQQKWYSDNAQSNASKATVSRYLLLIGELIAVVAAAIAVGSGSRIEFAGIVAAMVAGGAAWLAIKQYSQLTSAYRVAGAELAIQHSALESVRSQDWPAAVADAEEAISREHTMWLASRGEEPINIKEA